jgi:hypothetical protein
MGGAPPPKKKGTPPQGEPGDPDDAYGGKVAVALGLSKLKPIEQQLYAIYALYMPDKLGKCLKLIARRPEAP